MKTEIFYFSGTGNSLAIATDIAKRLDARVTPMAQLRQQASINCDAEVIGLVFPVYYGNLPNIVAAFARKLSDIQGKYLFVVANFGGGAGVSIRSLTKVIRQAGGEISAKYALQMPQNSWRKPWEDQAKLLRKYQQKIPVICRNTDGLKIVRFHTNLAFDLLQMPLQLVFNRLVKSHFLKITHEPKTVPLEQLIGLSDRSFQSTADCNACGRCSQVCPVDNIRITHNQPEWLNHCENCLACYNFCPQKAIKVGIMAADFHYLHPTAREGLSS